MASYRPSLSIHIPKPCAQSWEALPGDVRVRHCGECGRDVHNVAAMTAGQLEAVLAQDGPTPCLRLVRNEDGTVLVARPPATTSAWQRVTRTLSTVMLFAGSAAAQTAGSPRRDDAVLTGMVVDATGAAMPGAKVELRAEHDIVSTVLTDSTGRFELHTGPGKYALVAERVGFEASPTQIVELHAGVQAREQPIALHLAALMGQVAISTENEPLPTASPLSASMFRIQQDPGAESRNEAVLLGTVADATAAPIAHASVWLERLGIRVSETTTDDHGKFRIAAGPGGYSVHVLSPGFRFEAVTVKLHAGTQMAVRPFLLEVGKAYEGIVVTSSIKTKKVK